MKLSCRFNDALHEILDEGCPVVRDPDTGRRCRRRRYARRRCFACAQTPAKPLALVAAHAEEYGRSLSGAFLERARLAGAEFRWVNLRYARLSGATLAGADLRGADFSGTDISSADFRGADLTHARLRALRNLAGARFDGAVLEEAVLSTVQGAEAAGAPRQARDAALSQPRRGGQVSKFTRWGGGGASFAHADLTGANLSHAVLPGADFRGARLVGTDLRESVLAGADFTGADLADADLAGADLTGTKFVGARLENVRLAAGKSPGELQERTHEPDIEATVTAECMRAFAGVRASSDRTRLRVLARKTPKMRREDSLDLVLPILEKEDVADTYAEEAVAALRSLGKEPSSRPFLIGLLSRGAEKVRLEAAAILAEPPLDEETRQLFRSILTSGAALRQLAQGGVPSLSRGAASGPEGEEAAQRSFRKGVFRALAPGVEDGDTESVKLARDLLEGRELFDGELIAALGQAGAGDEGYRRAVEGIAFDEARSEPARLAAARELAERFFDEESCARLCELIESAKSPRFRRNAFWFVARRVTDGDERAVELARRLLPVDPVLEPDIRWALAEGGDSEQAGYFLEVVSKGARDGWEGEAAEDGSGEPAGYDALVRAAQVLGKIGTAGAIEPLAELIRRDQGAARAPPGSPFSLTDAARDAILSIRSARAPVAAEEETSVEEAPVPEATAIEPAAGEEAAARPDEQATRLEPVGEETVVETPDEEAPVEGAGEETRAEPVNEPVNEPVIEPAGEETRIEPAAGPAPEEAGEIGLSPEDVFGPEAGAEEAEAGAARQVESQAERQAQRQAQRQAEREAEEEARRAREAEEAARKAEEERKAREAEDAARRAEEARKKREAEEAAAVAVSAKAVERPAAEKARRKPAKKKVAKKEEPVKKRPARRKAGKKKAARKKAAEKPKKRKKKA